MINDFIGQNVLITTQQWFLGPDGQDYKAIWGKLHAIHEAGKTLGFIPNRSHANWFYEIGNMIIMGCQGMYITKCENKPPMNMVKGWTVEAGILKEYEKPSTIYISE